jgi:hypothetical protein
VARILESWISKHPLDVVREEDLVDSDDDTLSTAISEYTVS